MTLENIRRVPAVGVLAERELGGFLAIAALVGVGVGLGAAALVLLLEAMEHLLGPALDALFAPEEHGLLSWSRAWIFLTVPAGLLVSWWVVRRYSPEVAGDGVPQAISALVVHGGRMRARVAPLKLLTTALTVGSGGSAGREGPIVQIGGAVGSVVSKRFGLGEDQVRSLVAAGAGAGVGAAFNAPIAGMLFALEVILSSFAPRHMSAIVIASVAAAITSQSIVGTDLALQAGTYQLGSPAELLAYTGLALIVVVLGYFFLNFLDGVEKRAQRSDRSWGWRRPVGFGLIVAALIFLEPQLFGTGQAFTNTLLLNEQVTAITGSGGGLWWTLMLLAVGKAVATSFTVASGGSGGAFMPSLFMGATLGSGFARLVDPVWFGSTPLQPGAFAVVGMAAMFAVVGRAPLTAILIVFEVTGARDYGLIVPLMLASTLATFLAERFHKDSVYTQALRRMGVVIRRSGSVDILDTVDVGTVMAPVRVRLAPEQSVADAESLMHAHRSHGLPVVQDDRLVGVVTLSDIARAVDSAKQSVAAVMTSRPVTVTPSTPVSVALERMAAMGVGRLPVVEESDPGRLVGMFRREEAVRAYHEALSSTTDAELHRMRLAQRTDPGAGYYDFRVPPGSMADNRSVREVTWPEGSTLVSVRRGREVLIPTGDTVLLPGDVVTAFGTGASRRLMIDRLNAGAEEPTAEIELGEVLTMGDDGSEE
ncbi:MAG: chloride channel protein [Actinobacteria bacterium]|nr:chloride channel protein [Actinomycetota bacterium]